METIKETYIPNPTVAALPRKWAVICLVIITTLYFSSQKIYHTLHYESTDNAQIESIAIPVVNRASGFIRSFALKDYQSVVKGQLLLTIDDREYRIAVQQADADLAAAKADLSSANAQINNISSNQSVANAGVNIEQVVLAKTKRDMERDQALFNDGSITRHQLDNSSSAYQTAIKEIAKSRTEVNQVNTQTGTANAQIARAKATVALREAMLETAKLNLSYTRVIAPANGTIGKTNLESGQFIEAGQQLFSIVNNNFWIVANFKETQIGHMQVGQPVNIEVDGYPNKNITGKISDFSQATGAKFSLLPPDNSTGNFVKVTQRVPVKIQIDNANELRDVLKAGLSVSVDVKIK